MKLTALLVVVLALGPRLAVAHAAPAAPHPRLAQARSYATHGIIRSFGPGRALVDIAHEAIPGFMAAMTMTFEPRTRSQLDGLAEGDRVSFTFRSDSDGHLRLDVIRKE